MVTILGGPCCSLNAPDGWIELFCDELESWDEIGISRKDDSHVVLLSDRHSDKVNC